MLRSYLFPLCVSMCLVLSLCGCASKELARLEGEVGDLHSRLYQMQRSSERQATTTTDGLQQVSQSISEAFDEMRFKQSGLEQKIDQLSSRLLTAERQLRTLETGLSQLESRIEQGNRTLRQDLARQEQDHQTSLQKSAAGVADLRQSLASLQERQEKDSAALNEAVRRIDRDLGKRIDNLDNEVQDVYQQILKELGAVPATEAEGYPEDVYIVAQGDTLGGIAQSLGVSPSALQELNGITDPDRIFVGQRLKIPK